MGQIIPIIILILLGSFLYYLGGQGQKLYRRIGTNLCAILIFCILNPLMQAWWYLIPLTFITQYACLSTYFKFNEPDVLWYHWIITGLMYGLSALPLLWGGASMVGFIIRSIILLIGIVWVSERSNKVFVEEFFRGILYTSTYLLL